MVHAHVSRPAGTLTYPLAAAKEVQVYVRFSAAVATSREDQRSPGLAPSSVSVGILVGWSSGCVLRAARPPEAAISALARSWLHVVAVYHTLGLGAVFHGSIRVVRDFLRRGACRNPSQRNPGGQDESDETHGDLALGGAVKHSRYAGHQRGELGRDV